MDPAGRARGRSRGRGRGEEGLDTLTRRPDLAQQHGIAPYTTQPPHVCGTQVFNLFRYMVLNVALSMRRLLDGPEEACIKNQKHEALHLHLHTRELDQGVGQPAAHLLGIRRKNYHMLEQHLAEPHRLFVVGLLPHLLYRQPALLPQVLWPVEIPQPAWVVEQAVDVSKGMFRFILVLRLNSSNWVNF